MTAREAGYKRSYSGFKYAAKRMGLCGEKENRKPPRKHERRYPELSKPGEKVQIDVKEVPYHCLKGAAKREGKHLYQWTAIDECTRIRFIYGFEEHTPENSVKFLEMLKRVFPFKIQTVQTDNGTEFTYKYISETKESPFDKALREAGIEAASTLCSRVTAVRLAVSGRDRRNSSPAGPIRAEKDKPAGRRINFAKTRQEYRREKNSPATIPAAAMLTEGMLPLSRISKKVTITKAIRTDCSIS